MSASQTLNKDLVFATNVQKSAKEGDFYIEIFPHTSEDMDCDGEPITKIRNFDELIDFFEKE